VYKCIKLKSKLVGDKIKFNTKDSVFTLQNWRKRQIYKDRDSIFSGNKLDTVFSFTPKDLIYKSALSQEMPSDELMKFIRISKKRGVKNLNAYLVEFHKRTSLPIASYILTIIAVALAFRKKRGGTGINLAIGVAIMFIYVFLMKISEVLGAVAGVNSLLYVWMPNFFFGSLAIYLYYYAKK
jgi:lipopolysaccharide export system permease protein